MAISKAAAALALPVLLMVACEEKPETKAEVGKSEASDEVFITNEQLQAIDFTMASVKQETLQQEIKANGMIHVPPQNLTSISSYLGGVLAQADLLIGDEVSRGDVLARLNSTDYIDLQQEFLDLNSQLSLVQEELTRQEALRKDEINSVKNLTQAKTDFQSINARLQAVTEKLRLIGTNIESLQQGNISRQIVLRAPFDGYVDKISASRGSYIQPNQPIYTIIDPQHQHLELSIYEQDVDKIKVGQKVIFNIPGSNIQHEAEVYVIGKSITEERILPVHCHYTDESLRLPIGTYVEAKVQIGAQNAAMVPSSALILRESSDYILTEISEENSGRTFRRIPITRGTEQAGWTQINTNETIQAVVDGGSYFIASAIEMQAEG